MTIQYTANLGGSDIDIVRTVTAADPVALEVAVILATNVHTANGYKVSSIAEAMEDIANRFLNATQYGIRNNGAISGLAKDPDGANGIVAVVANILALGLEDVTILLGPGITQIDDALVNQTILTIKDYYLSTDGVL